MLGNDGKITSLPFSKKDLNLMHCSHTTQLSFLEEKPTSAKLNMLYAKSTYLLALNVARSQCLDESSVGDIHQQHDGRLYT